MSPRFEMIADYPGSVYEKGDILTGNKPVILTDSGLHPAEKYPHLFRKMNWWERRSIEELPGYIKKKLPHRTDVYKVLKWVGSAAEVEKSGFGYKIELSQGDSFFPATEQEYLKQEM